MEFSINDTVLVIDAKNPFYGSTGVIHKIKGGKRNNRYYCDIDVYFKSDSIYRFINPDKELKLYSDNNLEINLKECTLIKKETKLMRYKVKTKLIVNFPEGAIIEKHQTSNVYKSNNDPCTWLTADLVENNPGFFQKIEFTEENIIKLRHKLNNLDARFHAFGTSEGFIKEFKEFEKIVKEMGEFL